MRNEVLNDACCIECRTNLKGYPHVIEFKGINVYCEYLYQEEIRLAILQYKESCDQYLACILLHPYWSYYFRKHVVVLVPSTNQSRLKRGFDHIELLAIKSGFDNVHHVFEHNGLEQQAIKIKDERKGVFKEIKLVDIESIKDRKVLILDDIVTSGSTILACEELLKPYALSVDVLSVARSPQLQGSSKRLHLPFI